MRKWWFHKVSSIFNALTATIILIFLIYDLITHKNDRVAAHFLYVFLILLIYSIYITADFWGLKLYYRFKNADVVSFKDIKSIQVILILLSIVQLFAGYISFIITRSIMAGITNGFIRINNSWSIMGYLILIVFFTALVVLFGNIFLIKAIKLKRIKINQEIENFGKSDIDVANIK